VHDTLANIDPSRLISPAANIMRMAVDKWPAENDTSIPAWTSSQLLRGNMDFVLGYGAEWSKLREFGDQHRPYLNSNSHAWVDFESEETIGQPNWQLLRGKPYYKLYSYEQEYDTGSIGRVLYFNQWEQSQAWQALTAYEAYRKKRWLGFDGMNWCPLRGGGNTATYMKPAVGYRGHAKLAYHTLGMVYQRTLAGSQNVDLVYGPADTIPVAVMHTGDRREVDVRVAVETIEGEEQDRKTFEQVILPQGRGTVRLGTWTPELKAGRHYAVVYRIVPAN
jgi:hypothetical protein